LPSPDDEPAGPARPAGGAVADAPPKPPAETSPSSAETEEQAVPATEQEQGAKEEAPDSGAGGPEEEAAPEGEEKKPSYDRSEITDRLDALAEADPELAEELRKKFAPPDAEEQQAKVQMETNQATRQQRVSQAAGQAFQYLGQNVDQGIDEWAVGLEGNLQADIAELIKKQQESTDPVSVGGLLDTRTMRDQLKSYIQQAQVTYGNWRESSIAHMLMTVLEQSSAHQHLTTEQREQVKQAQQMSSLEESLAVQVMIHLQASDNSSDETFKVKTKKEIEQELGLVQKSQELLEKLGNGARARPARGGSPGGGRTDDELVTAMNEGKISNAAFAKELEKRPALREWYTR